MVKRTSMMRKLMVLMMAFAIMLTYSVVPMNQSFAASAKKPTKITLNAKSKTLTVGQTFKAKVKKVKPSKASKAVKWKSSNKKVATVSSKGVIKAKKAGKATITAVSKKNKKAKAKIKITVKNAVVPVLDDNQVFVDPEYVDALLHSGRKNVVLAEVSWGPDAPSTMIPGAIHVNTDDLEDNLKDGKVELWDLRGADNGYKELIAALESYGITTDTELVCYSWNAKRSDPTRLAMAALMMGVQKVRVLDGGSDAWEAAGYTMTTKAAAPKKASFGRTTPLHPEWVISTDDLVKKLASDNNFKAVSIRSYDEFIGMNSGYGYIDKAGEPKGAIWGHDTDDGSYVKEDGTVVGIDVLESYLKDYGASTKNELAFYCGTGWRATIPFLICYQAGITNMKLWDDGWYVYSGAFADDWNSPEFKPEMKPVGDYPVQIGDPKKGNVTYTTTSKLEGKYCPLGMIAATNPTVKAETAGKLESNFEIKPPKKTALNSVKFTSSDTSVAEVDATGAVTIKDASKFTTVTIKAETYATAGSTPEKAGGPARSASYTIQVGQTPDFINMSSEDWDKYGIAKSALKDTDAFIDVRTAEMYNAGHIKGAVNATVSNPYTSVQQEVLVDTFNEKKDAERIVIVCVSGNKLARSAMQALLDAGCDISKVTYLKGGATGAPELLVHEFINMDDETWASYGIEAGDLKNSDYVVDVRPAEKKAADGYAAGAAESWVANPYTPDQANKIFAEYNKMVADSKTDRLVIVCVSGNKLAKNAMDALEAKGADLSKVTYLKGGFGTWSQYLPVVSPNKDKVTVNATVNPTIYMNTYPDQTHHVLVNEKGSNADKALLNTKALPLQVYKGLEAIGGKASNGFNKADAFESDGKTAKVGAMLPSDAQKLNVNFEWDENGTAKTAGMSDFFKHIKTKGGDNTDVEDFVADMRFGGCYENIEQNWDSTSGNQTGCITCTFSCWIGTVSNGAYGYSTQEALVNRANVPAAGTTVKVVYTLGA